MSTERPDDLPQGLVLRVAEVDIRARVCGQQDRHYHGRGAMPVRVPAQGTADSLDDVGRGPFRPREGDAVNSGDVDPLAERVVTNCLG